MGTREYQTHPESDRTWIESSSSNGTDPLLFFDPFDFDPLLVDTLLVDTLT